LFRSDSLKGPVRPSCTTTLNAGYILKEEQRPIVIVAATDIAEGEEVAVDYSRGGSNSLWFVPLPEA